MWTRRPGAREARSRATRSPAPERASGATMRAAVLLVTLAGCFAPDLPNGEIPCPQSICPDGFYCADDGKCYEDGTSPRPCDAGYHRVGGVCADIDECTAGTAACDVHADCDNVPGTYHCACRAGWSGDGKTCADIDECTAGTAGCSPDATCTNGPGNYSCLCNAGFAGDGRSCYPDYVQVSVDGDHGCGVRSDGALYCWGSNARGQLGLGASVPRSLAPARVVGWWKQVAAALGFTCGIQADDTLWCWGDGSCGQLGNGAGGGCRAPLMAAQPVPVVAPGATWKHVSTSPQFACAIAIDGSLWCWGQNASGRLGLGDALPSPNVPTRVGDATDWSAVATGGTHTCGLRAGKLNCFGDNGLGQLGDGGVATPYAPVPKQIGGASSWIAVAAGQSHTCAVLGDHTLYCWGDDTFGQLGAGTPPGPQAAPIPLPGTFSTVTAGAYHTCGRRVAGGVACWGRNRSGEVGDGTFDERDAPATVAATTDLGQLAAGSDVTCGLAADGHVFCWGWNGQAALGVGRGGPREAPAEVGNGTWKALAAGATHACGIRADDSLWCWGGNEQGQLGVGVTGGDRDAPQPILPGTSFVAVATSVRNTCAVATGGALYCWGENATGQVGTGTAGGNVDAPQKIGDAYAAVALGDTHACGLAGGSLSCWGDNTYGQLGLGAGIGSQAAPAPVSAGWDAIACGGYHTCGRRDGELWCWGYNGAGAVGNGDAQGAPVRAPQRIGADADWSLVTGGESHTCGLRDVSGARRLYCWGDGFYGQLGNGTSGTGALLRAPGGLGSVSWSFVGAGYLRTCAVRQDGVLNCWGYNGPNGLLGLGTIGDAPVASTPTPVGSRSDWGQVALGWTMSLAVSRTGMPLAWGADDVGQIGDDATYFETPTPLN